MSVKTNKFTGEIVVREPSDDDCLKSIVDYINKNTVVDFTSENEFVGICNEGFNADTLSQICVSIDRNGTFLGFRQLKNGKFVQVPDAYIGVEVRWFTGDATRDNPQGWKILDDNDGIRSKFLGTAPNWTFWASVWTGEI